MIHRNLRFATAFAAVGLAAIVAARAATTTWSGGGVGTGWATAANWVGGVAPISGDDLVFPAGALQPTNVNDVAAGTSFRSITFQAAGYSISGNSIGISTASGITLTAAATGTVTISLAIALGISQTWTVTDAAATLEVSGVISGSSKALTKAGAGTFKISGTASNTHTGATTVNAGIVLLSKTSGKNAYGGTLVVNSGTVLLLASNQMPSKRVTVVSPGLVDLNNFSDTIGAITLTGGTIATGTGTITPTGSVTGNASAISATISGNLALGGNRTFTINNGSAADDLLITAVVSGANSITKSGAGTLTLAGNNTYTGTTSINAGQLIATANNGLGTSAGGTTVASGTTLGIRGGITYGTAEPVTINGTGLSAAGAISSVSGNNSVAWPITAASAATIASATAGDTLTLTGALVNGGFAVTFGGTGNAAANGVISGSGALTKTGSSTLTLAAAATYSGATTISTGTVSVTNGSGSPTGSGAVTVAAGAALRGANATAITGTSTFSNGAILTPGVAGAGTLRLGTVVLNSTSTLSFDLGTSSDQAQASGNLTLDGVLNVTPLAGFAAGTFTLFTYTGSLTNNTVTIGTMPAGRAYSIDVATAGQVALRVHPIVASIVRTGSDPTNAASASFAVTFSEAVTGVDSGDFALTTTGAIAGASVSSISGSGAAYTVTVNTGSGSGTIRLDLSDNNSIAAGGNPLGGPAVGDGSFTSGQAYTIDKTAPSVVSSNRAGANPTGAASVDFTVTFTETVTGVDLTDFALTTTGVIAGAAVTGVAGSGSTYTVTINTGTGDGTARLNVTDDDSIVDALGNPLGGTGSANGNFTAGQAYTVDKASPTVAMSSTTTNPTNVSPIPVTVSFDKAVTGFVATDIVASNGTVGNFAGSGASYSFNLTPVAQGPVTADIPAAVAVDSDGHSNLAAPQFARTYDSVAPTMASIVRTGANPTNAAGVSFTVTLSEAVLGVDSADFLLTTTGSISGAVVSGVSGSGSVYSVTVQTGAGSGTLRLDVTDDDSVRDPAGNQLGGAGLGNGSFTTGQAFTIDRTAPTVTTSSTATDPGNASPIPVTVSFSESVTGFVGSDITAGNGTVTNFAGSGASYTFDLVPGADGLVTADIAAGMANDAAGNGNNAAPQLARTYDTVSSTVLNVSSTVQDGVYGLGFTVPILVAFDEAIVVTGAPKLTLATSSAPNGVATYASGSGTATLTFNYAVAAGESSADLDYVSAAALALNGGTMRDAAGNNADLTLAAPGAVGSLGDNNNIVVSSTTPGVSTVSSTSADGSYKAGSTIPVTITFSQAVAVTGTPQLTLDTSSSPNGVAAYASGSGTTTLTFNYVVAAGQNSPDLEYLSNGALALNGGTIKRFGGATDAILTLPDPGTAGALGFNKAIVIDTTAPTISSVSSTTSNGAYAAGAAINVTVSFSETITLAGENLNVTLDTGAVVAIPPFGPATSVGATYAVGAGQSSPDLTATSPLTLSAGATLRDAAGNNAALAIPAGQNIADLKAIVIDTIAPTISNVTSTTPNGTYGNGATVDVTVNFSEAVTLAGGGLRVTLDTGAVLTIGSFGPAVLASGTYTVGAGQSSPDLTAVSPLALTGGATLRDAAGNAGTLTIPAGQNIADLKAIVIDSAAAMTLVKSASVSTGRPGDPITYTLTYTNIGILPLSNIVVRDTLSTYTSFVSATPSVDAGFPDSADALRWTIPGSLPAGASGSVSCTVQIK